MRSGTSSDPNQNQNPNLDPNPNPQPQPSPRAPAPHSHQVRDLTAKVNDLERELELCRLALHRWQARGTVSPLPGSSPGTNQATPLRELPQGTQGQGEVRRDLARRELELSNEREAREKGREHARKLQLQLDAAVAKARATYPSPQPHPQP